VAPPRLDQHLGFPQAVEDLTLQQFVAQLVWVTPIERAAASIVCPCATSTSTCLSLATISSGACRFLLISPLHRPTRHT
jgi:hypothetical protein